MDTPSISFDEKEGLFIVVLVLTYLARQIP